MEIAICRDYSFDAAHRLDWHPGKCRNLHGHTYRLQVCVTGPLDERGVVMDFAELDEVVETNVLSIVDHSFLNEIIDNPTAERVALWVWNRLGEALPISELVLWETLRSSVRLTRHSVA